MAPMIEKTHPAGWKRPSGDFHIKLLMKPPTIEIIPLRPAFCFAATMDVLIKITPPAPEANLARTHLNLGLVLDRSGSMGSRNKMAYARDAAIFAIESPAAAIRRVAESAFTVAPQTLPVPCVTRSAVSTMTVVTRDGLTAGRSR